MSAVAPVPVSGPVARRARLFAAFAAAVVDLAGRRDRWPLADARASLTAGECPVRDVLEASATADRGWTDRLAVVVDFCLSDLSGFGPTRAWALDRRWRGNRVLGPGDVLTNLASAARADHVQGLPQALAALERGRVATAARLLAERPDAAPEVVAALDLVRREVLALAEERVSVKGAGPDAFFDALGHRLGPVLPPAPPLLAVDGPQTPLPEGGPEPAVGALYLCPVDPRTPGLPRLSASQVESYLECPGKWLALRRLSLGTVDAGFGGAELGSLAHRMLEQAWGTAAEEGLLPLDGEGVARLHDLLNEAFDDVMGNQVLKALRVQGQSTVPHDPHELAVLGRLVEELHGSVDWEAARPTGLVPVAFEAPFGREGEPCVYGGASWVGTVDRVDAAPDGAAVVIDYKHRSDLLASFAGATGPDGVGPRHVQAFVYASLLPRAVGGLRGRGALYLATRPPYGRVGDVDADVLDKKQQDAYIGRDGSSVRPMDGGDFDATLASVEARVARAVSRLLAADLAPDPVDAQACSFCPYPGCPRRHGAPPCDGDDVVAPLVAFLAQPADTARGLAPLLTGPLFGLDAADLVLLATGRGDDGSLRKRSLERGVLAGGEGLTADPSPRLARALAVLGEAVGLLPSWEPAALVAHVVERSGYLGRLQAAGEEGHTRIGALSAALSRLGVRSARDGAGFSVAARDARVGRP